MGFLRGWTGHFLRPHGEETSAGFRHRRGRSRRGDHRRVSSAAGANNNGFAFISLEAQERMQGNRRRGDQPAPARSWRRSSAFRCTLQAAQDLRVGVAARDAPSINTPCNRLIWMTLRHWTPLLVDKLKTVKDLQDVNTDQQARGLQQSVIIDRDAAARLGIQPQAVDDTLYSAFGQRQVSVIYTQQNQYRVVLETEPEFDEAATSLDKSVCTLGDRRAGPAQHHRALRTDQHVALREPPRTVSGGDVDVQHRAGGFAWETPPN